MKIIRLNEKESAENSLGDWVQTARHKNAIECIDALSDKIAQFKDGHRQKRCSKKPKKSVKILNMIIQDTYQAQHISVYY